MNSKTSPMIRKLTAFFVAATLPITSCKNTSAHRDLQTPYIAPDPVKKISSLNQAKDFTSSFSHIYVVQPKSGPRLQLVEEKDQPAGEVQNDTKKKIIGTVVGSVLGVAILVGGGIAFNKILRQSNNQRDLPGRNDPSFSPKNRDSSPNALPGFDPLGNRVGQISPQKTELDSSFVEASRAYTGDFNDVVAAITQEKAAVSLINSLDDVSLPSQKRALIVIDAGSADNINLGPIGSVVRKNVAGTGDVQYQVIGRNEKSVLMAAQRFEDIDAGTFPRNLALIKGKPWEGKPSLGAGGEGEVFDMDGYAVKVALFQSDKLQLELAKVLQMQHIDGVVKVKGMYQTEEGEFALMFEKLQRKNFAEMTDSEFETVAKDLAKTADELKKMTFEHSDISPGNIMFRGDKPVLIDVGTGAKTPGYSGMGDDSVALARSLIDLRMGEQIKTNFLSVYDDVDDLMRTVGKNVGDVSDSAEDLKDIQNGLIHLFLSLGSGFSEKMGYIGRHNVGKDRVRELFSSGSTSLAVATEGLKMNLDNFRAFLEMDLSTFEQKWISEYAEQFVKMGDLSTSSMASSAFENGDLVNLVMLKIKAAHGQTVASLAQKSGNSRDFLGSYLEKQVFDTWAAGNSTIGDLVAVANKEKNISDFAKK